MPCEGGLGAVSLGGARPRPQGRPAAHLHGEPQWPMGARGRACWEPGWAGRAAATAAAAGGARWDLLWAVVAAASVVAEAVGARPGPGRLRPSRGPESARGGQLGVRPCGEAGPQTGPTR